MTEVTQQKALYLDALHGPWVVRNRDIPSLKANQALVRNLASALNPVGWKLRELAFFGVRFPAVVGSEAAGEVGELGEDVVHFKKGDTV